MGRFWLVLILLALPVTAPAQEKGAEGKDSPAGAHLVLSTGGHTAPVRKVFFTPDGKEVITVSDDKTVRFWDVDTGEALRVVRPPVGPGTVGDLYAAALSPDGKTLAVGGFMKREGPNPIFLINVADGQITGALREHTG